MDGDILDIRLELYLNCFSTSATVAGYFVIYILSYNAQFGVSYGVNTKYG